MQLKDIDEKIIKEVKKSGLTLESIAITPFETLMQKLNITKEEAKNLLYSAQESIGISPKTATEFLELENRRGFISTSSNELDSILGGGVYTQEITELVGAFSSGKTQISFQLCINVQQPKEEGGLSGKAFFIDTERTFSPKRIAEMASERELDTATVLDNILVVYSMSTDHLAIIINQLEDIIKKENVKLIVIDSFASHFRSEYIGKDKLIDRQQKIMSLAEKLVALSVKFDVAVVVTNQIIAAVDQFLYGGVEEPALGYAWAHRPQQRIFLRKSRGTARIARLFDSSRMPEREALFYVTSSGIGDSSMPTDFY